MLAHDKLCHHGIIQEIRSRFLNCLPHEQREDRIYGWNVCWGLRSSCMSGRSLWPRDSSCRSTEKPGCLGKPSECNRWCTESIEMLLVSSVLYMQEQWMWIRSEAGAYPHDTLAWQILSRNWTDKHTWSYKMLGVWSTLSGDDAKHLEEVIIGKTQTWVGRFRNKPLPHHLAWMLYCNQLWSGLCYGLGTLATQTSIIKSGLHFLEFEMLPSLGVNWHVKREW